MRLTRSRLSCALLPMLMCATSPPRLGAQDAPGGATPPRPSTHCGFGNRAVRTVGGAGLGAWLGFMTIKIKVSDWSDEARSSSVHRQRNQAIAAGALLGAAIGNLPFWSRCAAPRLDNVSRLRERRANRPITAEEIEHSGITGNVYDVVYALRRNWLSTRGVNSLRDIETPLNSQPVVYLDNIRIGNTAQLENISLMGVTLIRYYDTSEATFRFGAGHALGAIEVVTVSEAAPKSSP